MAVIVSPPSVAKNSTEIVEEEDFVVMVNVAEDAPAGTVTLVGTVALALFDDR